MNKDAPFEGSEVGALQKEVLAGLVLNASLQEAQFNNTRLVLDGLQENILRIRERTTDNRTFLLPR